MRIHALLRTGALIAAAALYLHGQPAPEAPGAVRGMPPRASAAEYLAQGKAGAVSIGAEFKGHSIPTPEGPMNSEEYIVVEVGLFGAPGARLTLEPAQFSLRVNGKKSAEPARPDGMVVGTVKDPEWVSPEAQEDKKSKTSLNAGGGGGQAPGEKKEPPKVPLPTRRAWAARVQKMSLAEGDRPLPQAGLLYFENRGKNFRSLELIYEGPAGKATIALQP